MKSKVESVFRGRKVLVTGHTGFKGSWLVALLEKLGAKVCGVSLAPEPQSHFGQLNLSCESHICDIRDSEKLTTIFRNFQPELVYHLAAQPLVRSSYKDPVLTYETNVIGSLKVYLATQAAGSATGIVSITTDKVYENLETDKAYLESDRLGGHDPYSSSKACAEIMSQSFRSSFLSDESLKLVTVRAGNIFGGGDWSTDRIVPDLMRAAMKNEITPIRSPNSVRPWQHVLDPLWGYVMMGERILSGETLKQSYNLGPDPQETYTVRDLCKEFQKVWAAVQFEVEQTQPTLHEAKNLKLDSTLADVDLGWKPRLSFQEACRWTAEWYERQNINSETITRAQISKYLELCASSSELRRTQ